LGEDWTSETKQAWVEAYGTITDLMLDGADYSPESTALNPE
jgi:hemoglobin-like flavoprotein